MKKKNSLLIIITSIIIVTLAISGLVYAYYDYKRKVEKSTQILEDKIKQNSENGGNTDAAGGRETEAVRKKQKELGLATFDEHLGN